MTKWEYTTFAFQQIDGAQLQNAMNALGHDGWEYCGQSAIMVGENPDVGITAGMMYVYLFKRPSKLVTAAPESALIGL